VFPAPQTTVQILLKPFFSKTSPTIFPRATVQRLVDSEPFQITVSPQIRASATFHPLTATGKLKAVITPTFPIGFHYSIIKCEGLSLGRTLPSMVLDIPTAMSQISIYS